MRHVYLVTLFVCVLLVSILGFRGTKFTSPPLDIFPEWAFPSMEHQPKFRPQSENDFFADGRADRAPPPRTVALPPPAASPGISASGDPSADGEGCGVGAFGSGAAWFFNRFNRLSVVFPGSVAGGSAPPPEICVPNSSSEYTPMMTSGK